MASKRAGVLVVILIAGMTGTFLIYLVQRSRAAARHQETVDKIGKMALALHACNDLHKRLPPAFDVFANVKTPASLHVHLLPFLEQDALYQSFLKDGEGKIDAVVPAFHSSADPSLREPDGIQNFAGNLRVFADKGVRTIVNADMPELAAIEPGAARIPATFQDGTSNTVVLATKFAVSGIGGSHYAADPTKEHAAYFGQNAARKPPHAADAQAAFQIAPQPSQRLVWPLMAQSFSATGITVAMGDGSVRGLSPTISAKAWNKAMQPNDGPVFGADWGGEALGSDWGGDVLGSDGGPWRAARETPSAATKSPATTKAPLSSAPSPVMTAAVADPVTGTARSSGSGKQLQGLPSGILTAGSFDDNLDPDMFHAFVKQRGQQRGVGDLPQKMLGQRLMILVKDSAGKPVAQARVKLATTHSESTNQAEVVTRSDGRAVFLLSWDQLPTDQPLLATVRPPDGLPPVTERISPGAPRWEITLPGLSAQLPKNLDLAFVVDTTGSMSDELKHLQAEVRGISTAIHERFPEVQQRFGLVVYRDDGDDYVVRSFEFTPALEKFHKNLAAQRASGGGDYPEAMHRGLEEATQLRWREDDTARVLFLIADAPPHAQHMNRTMTAANLLRQKGVAIYPVACSGYDDACEFVMRSCALLTGSQFLFLTDDSGVGGAHAEPKIPYYRVERLEKLMVRMIAGELCGRRIDPAVADILRTVGKRVN